MTFKKLAEIVHLFPKDELVVSELQVGVEYEIAVAAPGLSDFEIGLDNEIFNLDDKVDFFIKHATELWESPKLEPPIRDRLNQIYRESRAQIIANEFDFEFVWAFIETEFARPLVNTVSHSYYEKSFLRMFAAVQDQFYSSIRYSFFECVKKSGVGNGFDYWLKVYSTSPFRCLQRASRNPYTFEKALEQNSKHRNCDCYWFATLNEKFSR